MCTGGILMVAGSTPSGKSGREVELPTARGGWVNGSEKLDWKGSISAPLPSGGGKSPPIGGGEANGSNPSSALMFIPLSSVLLSSDNFSTASSRSLLNCFQASGVFATSPFPSAGSESSVGGAFSSSLVDVSSFFFFGLGFSLWQTSKAWPRDRTMWRAIF